MTLLEQLKHLRKSYEDGNPEISDDRYDLMVQEYLKRGGKYEDIYGDQLLNLEYPLMSQQNIYTLEDFNKSLRKYFNQEYVMTPKYDGVSVCFVIYKSTRKSCAIYSRHGKRFHECVEKYLMNLFDLNYHERLKYIKAEEFTNKSPYFYVRCEVILSKENFKKHNNGYANPRNFVAGMLNSKTLTEKLSLGLGLIHLLPFDVSVERMSYSKLMDLLKMPYRLIGDNGEIEHGFETKFEEQYKHFNSIYECDGLVLRMNHTPTRFQYGNTGHHWYVEGAIKNQIVEELESRVYDVEWNMSETGKYTPVALIEPIQFKDAVVSRVTLNSMKYIDDMNIKIGSKVTVIKSGDIIPKIIEVEGLGADIDIDECQHCGSMLSRNGAYYYCENKKCEMKLFRNMVKQIIILQDIMGLKGIAEKSLQNFLEQHSVKISYFKELYDLYLDDDHIFHGETDISKKLNKFFKKLRSHKFEIGDIIFSFNIQGFGKETRDKLNEYFIHYRKDVLIQKKIFILALQQRLAGFFIENTTIDSNAVKRLFAYIQREESNFFFFTSLNVIIPEHQEGEEDLPKYIFTGSPTRMSKKEFKEFVKGKAVQTTTVNKSDYVICNDPSKKSAKYQKGLELGKKVMNQEEFLKEIGL